jgi:hypothetical protein
MVDPPPPTSCSKEVRLLLPANGASFWKACSLLGGRGGAAAYLLPANETAFWKLHHMFLVCNLLGTRGRGRSICYRPIGSVQEAFWKRPRRDTCRLITRCGVRWIEQSTSVCLLSFFEPVRDPPPPLRLLHIEIFPERYVHALIVLGVGAFLNNTFQKHGGAGGAQCVFGCSRTFYLTRKFAVGCPRCLVACQLRKASGTTPGRRGMCAFWGAGTIAVRIRKARIDRLTGLVVAVMPCFRYHSLARGTLFVGILLIGMHL